MNLRHCLLILGLSTAPLAAELDLDGDGTSDVWSALYGATDLVPTGDEDGDGCTNFEESVAGTDPFSAASKLVLNLPPTITSALNLSWPSVSGKSYQLMVSDDLASWSADGAPVIGNGGTMSVAVSAGQARRFWSLVVSDIDGDLDGLSRYEEQLLGFSDSGPTSHGSTGSSDFAAAVELFGSPGSFVLSGTSVMGSPPSLAESSRFLQQATMGATFATIEGVAGNGIPAWIETQFAIPATSHVVTNNALALSEIDEETGDLFTYSLYHWTWWNTALYAPDHLRQRVAFALSEIFVISQTTDELQDFYWGIATYYDILVNNAFGNYRDLLYAVSTNPAMGHYLSHVKNRPTDLAGNVFPDENYAREVMQLFSIGLFELNQDGSRKKDANNEDIPTYGNSDITEFARVFTGLTYNPVDPNNGTPYFNEFEFFTISNEEEYLGAQAEWMGIEMAGYEPMHEAGPKTLLGGQVTDGNLQQDLDAAIDNLFNHPNTGPFIGRLLIQRLVTSNPSPDYIYRVAAAFNDNGSGVRGDMKAVIRAILLDPEARNRSMINNPQFGKLREPVLRHTNIARAFGYRPSSGPLRVGTDASTEAYAQQPMLAPSVFNFYLPDHQPLGPIKDAGLVAPEFQITTATTTIKNLNFYSVSVPYDFVVDAIDESGGTELLIDYAAEIQLIENNDAAGLIDRLDILLTRGQMTANTRSALQVALAGALTADLDPEETVRFAITLVASSPDFAVLR
ncbi:MAG: DUF1800 domain-containing protein [Verrucomicrobiota bacterium]